MAQWNRVPLIDYIELIGGGTPKTTVPEYWNGNIPWLSVKDFNNDKRYVYSTEKHISQSGFENSPTKMLHKDDIIISARGTVGEIAMIPFDMAFNQSCYGIRASRGIDKPFLYYLLKNCISQLKRMTHGSVFDTITRDTFANIEVDIPDVETQKRISSVLADIDNKIEVNEAINDNLQQQLFSLYENMATASPCLKEYTLSNLCDFQEGYVNPPQTHPEYFDGEVKWLRAVDINESFIIETSRTLTKAGFESAKKSALLFEPNTIAISKSGTIGRLGIIADYMCGNRAVINIAPHDTNMLAFIYCFLKSKQREFPDMAVGSVQKNLYVSLLEPLSVSIPDNESLTAFNAVGASILGMIHNNCVENTDLANLRDTILPKLMSGEIDVSSVLL